MGNVIAFETERERERPRERCYYPICKYMNNGTCNIEISFLGVIV